MEKITVIVDTPNVLLNTPEEKSMLASLVAKAKQSSIELDAQVLSDSIRNIYTVLANSINDIKDINDSIEIEKVEFSVGIDSSGQVSLMSTLSGASQVKTGISFTLKLK